MTNKKASKLINKILKEEPVESGIFISILSYKYIKQVGISKTKFMKSLENSLKKLNESEVK